MHDKTGHVQHPRGLVPASLHRAYLDEGSGNVINEFNGIKRATTPQMRMYEGHF